ncbi:MAG: acyl-CoA dehydrogenase family protein [Hydrogenophilaceae bacterium]|jgi:alkylation response protein AidB-like acyl-CoA dehydrogenase|nr:acyl-CoA dehydrogenase family protein [Hydrogenophilaceae bacterium]
MFTLSEEHEMLRESARAFVQEKMPTAHLRAVREAKPEGFDRALWAEMAQLGWTGILIPEEHGGSALGYVGMGLVLEECGRTLAPSPLHSTALVGASAIALGGTAAQKNEWLPKIAAGELIVALAIDESAHHAPEKIKLEVKNGQLTGMKKYVADGHVADLLIVAAREGGVVKHFLVPANADGVTITQLKTLDSRGAADIAFKGAKAEPLGGPELVDQVLDRARIGLAAEMLGQASQAFETTSEYLKTRTQFGQLIGSFQALQHRAAKMFVELELTRSCVLAALSALDENRNDIAELASLAKARAGETLHLVSNEMVQMHGGIGMTDAADPGLYLKRARVAEALYGSASYHRDRYAALNNF